MGFMGQMETEMGNEYTGNACQHGPDGINKPPGIRREGRMTPPVEDIASGAYKGCEKDNRDGDAHRSMDGNFQKPKHERDGHDAASQPEETGKESNAEPQQKGHPQRNRRILLGVFPSLPMEKHLRGQGDLKGCKQEF